MCVFVCVHPHSVIQCRRAWRSQEVGFNKNCGYKETREGQNIKNVTLLINQELILDIEGSKAYYGNEDS